nr:uncharacterized protein LOC113724657 [Coffea arabica]XP_027103351.1 uncharacterized protein LOC113724670 [Coffea arabica]
MMHGPCGAMNSTCACMRKHIGCKDKYPKQFCESTIHTTNSYPVYRRQNDKNKVKIHGHYLDNRWQEVVAKDIETERNIPVDENDLPAIDQLNKNQSNAYEQILNAIINSSLTSFFVDGPGGTGKTFLYRALLAKIRSTGGIALATATSGVAASILHGGRTTHSRFKVPLHDDDSKVVTLESKLQLHNAQLIRDAQLIIWNEASMAKQKSIERFDEMMKDVIGCDALFGGKTVVFGGDFRQTLPVVTQGYKKDIMNASLVMSPIWQQLTKLKLREICELVPIKISAIFCFELVMTELSNHMNEVKIPTPMNVPFIDEASSVETLVSMVFPDMEAFNNNPSSIVNRAILMTRNDFVHEINDMLIDKFPGPRKTYLSFDETLDASHQLENQDFLNTLTPKGLPPHELKLKENCPVMLIRNIKPSEGLSNGT